MFNTAVTIAVLAAAILILSAIGESREMIEEHQEWQTEQRRAKYREQAYKQMDARWSQHVNREKLWEKVNK